VKIATAVTTGQNVEHRARRVAWGVEIEVWHRVNTITLPQIACDALAVSALLDPSTSLTPAAALPATALPPSSEDITLETPLDEHDPDEDADYELLELDPPDAIDS
jgi:hypothetical protein